MGSAFIVGNGLDKDYYSRNVTFSPAKPLLIAPRTRTETTVAIHSNITEDTALLIHSQLLQNKEVRLGNVINDVKQGKKLTIAINSSENPVEISPPKLEELFIEKFNEASINLGTVAQPKENNTSHMSRKNNQLIQNI